MKYFRDLGHEPYGLYGCEQFCQMATKHSGCKVYHQNFIELDLPHQFFDGIFANASLFHIPKSSLENTLRVFYNTLTANGILFTSNPRGTSESIEGSRYANFMEIAEYRPIVEQMGLDLIEHYYQPQGQPLENCP